MIKVDRWREKRNSGAISKRTGWKEGEKKECKKKEKKREKEGKRKEFADAFYPCPEGNDSRFLLVWSKFVGEF